MKRLFVYSVIFLIGAGISGCTKIETTYYSNGKVNSVITMQHGKKNGRSRYYYSNGALQQESYFKDDVPEGSLRRWRYDGILQLEEFYEKGLKNGVATTWDEKGNKISQMTWRNDTLNGIAREWYANGVQKVGGSYVNGVYDGRWLWMSPEGKVVGEGMFKDGKGEVTTFYLSGKRSSVTHFAGNEKDGREIAWDESGEVIMERTWDHGRIVRVEGNGGHPADANDNN